MKDRFIGDAVIAGGEPDPAERMDITPEPGARRTLRVCRGDTVYGYITGGTAAVLMTYMQSGMRLYCLNGERNEKEKGAEYTVKVYYAPDKI